MSIESLLARDFSNLIRKFDKDDFTAHLLKQLQNKDRLRLAAIGGAGAAGAALAASQFSAVTEILAKSTPIISAATAASPVASEAALIASPTLLAALAFAMVGASVAMMMPGGR